MCFGDVLPMRTLCDAYHKELAFNRGHRPNCNNVVIEKSKKQKAKSQIGIN